MDKKEIYLTIKENTSFLVNFLALVSLFGSGAFFIYSKVFSSDELRVVYRVLFVPQKDYKVLFYNYELNKDSVRFENCYTLTQIDLTNTKNKTVKNVEISLKNYFSDQSGIPKGFYIKDDENLSYFEGNSVIRISEIKPDEHFQVNIYSENPGIYADNIIVSEGGISRAREEKTIIVENNFDEWVTSLVVNNISIQILVYIFTLIGFYTMILRLFRYFSSQ